MALLFKLKILSCFYGQVSSANDFGGGSILGEIICKFGAEERLVSSRKDGQETY